SAKLFRDFVRICRRIKAHFSGHITFVPRRETYIPRHVVYGGVVSSMFLSPPVEESRQDVRRENKAKLITKMHWRHSSGRD
ncbi:MAG: hypothetical protein WAV56_02780, partial [Microgenomates group bacterium]